MRLGTIDIKALRSWFQAARERAIPNDLFNLLPPERPQVEDIPHTSVCPRADLYCNITKSYCFAIQYPLGSTLAGSLAVRALGSSRSSHQPEPALAKER